MNWPNMIAGAVLIGAVILVLQQFEAFERASKGRRALIAGLAAGITIFVFKLIWPG